MCIGHVILLLKNVFELISEFEYDKRPTLNWLRTRYNTKEMVDNINIYVCDLGDDNLEHDSGNCS